MAQPSYVLEIKYTDGSSERFEITDPKRVLGRSKIKADLQVQDAKASGAHAELRFAGGELTVKDLGSTNGTHFHGTRMQGDFQLLPGESFKVGDAVIQLVGVTGADGEAARTMVGAPMFSEEEESTRAVDAATLAALAQGNPPPSAPSPVSFKKPAPEPATLPTRSAPAPAQRPAPEPARPADWANFTSAQNNDDTPPGGAPLPPVAKAAPKAAPRPAARPAPPDSSEFAAQIAPPRKGLRVMLILFAVLFGLATMAFGALAGYVHVLNKEVKGVKALADAAVTQCKAMTGNADVEKDIVEGACAMATYWEKYSASSALGGWASLGMAGLAFFLIIGAFLRGTGFAWGVGLLGTIAGGVLIALTPAFEFPVGSYTPENILVAILVQPQQILAVMTGALGLLMLLAVGAGSLGRRARVAAGGY